MSHFRIFTVGIRISDLAVSHKRVVPELSSARKRKAAHLRTGFPCLLDSLSELPISSAVRLSYLCSRSLLH